jgi:hypothetical protein
VTRWRRYSVDPGAVLSQFTKQDADVLHDLCAEFGFATHKSATAHRERRALGWRARAACTGRRSQVTSTRPEMLDSLDLAGHEFAHLDQSMAHHGLDLIDGQLQLTGNFRKIQTLQNSEFQQRS